MYKSTSKGMQKSRGRDTHQKIGRLPKIRSKSYVRKKWYLRVIESVEQDKFLPIGLPSWLSLEIRVFTAKRWVATCDPETGEIPIKENN